MVGVKGILVIYKQNRQHVCKKKETEDELLIIIDVVLENQDEPVITFVKR